MSWLKGKKKALGSGAIYPANSVVDDQISATLRRYRRAVASRYRSLKSDEIKELPPGQLHCSPKIDGELWFLANVGGKVALLASNGRAIVGGIPLIKEAEKTFGSKSKDGMLVAGELFALSEKGRPRVGGVAKALGGDGDVARLGFQAFDLVCAEGGVVPPESYADRLAEVERVLKGGKRVSVIKTDVATSAADVQKMYKAYVESDKAEGLVVRSADERVFKIKPTYTLDCVVVGFTQRSDDASQARSLLLGLTRPDGSVQLVGACGNLASDKDRKSIKKSLEPLVVESRFRRGSSSGALYRLTKPEFVVEIECTDLQALNADGDSINNWALEMDSKEGWMPLCQVPTVSLLHPRLVRVRSDKSANAIDTRISQVSERCLVLGQDDKAAAQDMPASKVERREVYTKETKGLLAVRKLLVWKTNKDDISTDFPAYVVHFTDFSPSRATQIKRTVRLAPDKKEASKIADDLIASQIKKGWKRA